MQDQRDKQRPAPNAVSHIYSLTPELVFLDVEAMQMMLEGLVNGGLVNDDCINVLLEALNPDPSLWYIAPTQLTLGISYEGSLCSKFPDGTSVRIKLMSPVHLPKHGTLAVRDRQIQQIIDTTAMEFARKTYRKF